LIRKANDGGSLSENEDFIFNEVFLSTWGFHYMTFGRAITNGRDPRPPAKSFTRYLKRYPGFRSKFESEGFRSLLNERHQEFIDLVNTVD
jgi:hypothetical protein